MRNYSGGPRAGGGRAALPSPPGFVCVVHGLVSDPKLGAADPGPASRSFDSKAVGIACSRCARTYPTFPSSPSSSFTAPLKKTAEGAAAALQATKLILATTAERRSARGRRCGRAGASAWGEFLQFDSQACELLKKPRAPPASPPAAVAAGRRRCGPGARSP